MERSFILEKTCVNCGRRFNARDDRQDYCSRIDCQRTRKRKWQGHKLATDTDYKQNQSDAQKRWRESHKSYWQYYRETHPAYRDRNRATQHKRNGKRKTDLSGVHVSAKGDAGLRPPGVIAKMDAASSFKSGTYRLVPYGDPLIAKMDAIIVELSLVSTG